MAFVNIENAPISIQLSEAEKVTVPMGETWNVNIFASNRSAYDAPTLQINGKYIHVTGTGSNNKGQSGVSFKTILKEGDVVEAVKRDNAVVVIGGFVVQKK